MIRLQSAGEYWTDLELATDGVTYKDRSGTAVNISLWRAGGCCPHSPQKQYLYISGTESRAVDGNETIWIASHNMVICGTP